MRKNVVGDNHDNDKIPKPSNMFEFNIEKHEPKTKYNRQGADCYLCMVRKRLIKVTPEERVRQALINYLVNEMEFPLDRINIEVPLLHYKDGTRGRADIVVLDPEDNPLILIECKEPNEIYADYVRAQLHRYGEVIKPSHYMIVIGNFVRVFDFDEDSNQLVTLLKMPPYLEFINGGEIEYEIEEKVEGWELPFKEPFDKVIIGEAIEEGFIGNGTNKKFYPFIFNMIGYFLREEKICTSEIQDIGIRTTKFGNAGGGAFPGEYRAYIFKRGEDNIIVSFKIISIYRTEVENSLGATCLAVAIDFEKTSHLSLELRIDKYVDIKNSKAIVWHDGTLTVGKLGMAKRKDVMDFIFEKAPHLIKDDKIYLGTFDLTKRITEKQEQTYDFIKRTIEYAIIRDEYRNEKKKQVGNSFKKK